MAHLKYVEEQDLFQLGMSKPEVRRLRKYYEKHYPQNYFAKIIKVFNCSQVVLLCETFCILSNILFRKYVRKMTKIMAIWLCLKCMPWRIMLPLDVSQINTLFLSTGLLLYENLALENSVLYNKEFGLATKEE